MTTESVENVKSPGRRSQNTRAHRTAQLVLDVTQALVFVGASVAVVVAIAAPWIPQPLAAVLGIWMGTITVLALPALVVLHASPPRVPLSERSALFASASWFARSVWAGVVFALSIVLGAVAGVVSSRISDAEHNIGTALQDSITGIAQVVLWPIVLTVAALAYVAMGIRWLLDLGRVVDEGGALQVQMTLEQRWFGPREISSRGREIRDAVSTVTVSLVGRIALLLALLTVAFTVTLTVFATIQNP